MKRTVAVLLSLIITAACFTACNESSSNTDSQKTESSSTVETSSVVESKSDDSSENPSSSVDSNKETIPDAKVEESGVFGKNGDNLKWEYYSNGTLVISGSGEMRD